MVKNTIFLNEQTNLFSKEVRGVSMLNFYSRADAAANITKDPLALKILLTLFPNKKYNAETLAKNLKVSVPQIVSSFSKLQLSNLIRDNPSSGNKVLTEEGIFFLEQTATVFPKLNEFLKEQGRIPSP